MEIFLIQRFHWLTAIPPSPGASRRTRSQFAGEVSQLRVPAAQRKRHHNVAMELHWEWLASAGIISAVNSQRT